MLSGLVISVGGLQESLRKASLAALLNYLQGDEDRNKSPREYMLSTDILSILQEFKRRDRVIIPTLKVIQFIVKVTCYGCNSLKEIIILFTTTT